jgi:DnaJ-domain-containing protein 1
MVRIIYRRRNSFYRPRRERRLVSSFDELLDLLLEELVSRPGPSFDTYFTHRDKPVSENLRSHRLWEENRETIGRRGCEPSTQRCSHCGMKFSTNLMKNGLCNHCRSTGNAESEAGGPQDPGFSSSVSDIALRQAYQVLGCDESDSDEVIKRRHRELAKEFHSDRLSPGASCDRVSTANERFCNAQEAYEIIMITRKRIT